MLRIEKISKEIIADLCCSNIRPDDWLPHTVYVEEVGEDERLGDIPVYTRYTLEDFKEDGSCTFRDMEGECRSGCLHEICIDWLFILRNRYLELCAEQGLWRERAIHMLEQETDASLPDILEFVGGHWENLASDAHNISAFLQQTASPAQNPLEEPLRRLLDVALLEIPGFEQSLTYDICAAAIDGLSQETDARQTPGILYRCSVCGGTDVACDARVNPNTGEIFSIFDEPDASCDKCGEVGLEVV